MSVQTNRAVRYPMNVIYFARTLAANGRSVDEVLDELAKHGHHPSRRTVRYWLDERLTERRRVYEAGRDLPMRRARERLRRIHTLRGIGLSQSSIAKLLNHEYGLDLNADAVRRLLAGDVGPRGLRNQLGGKA